MQLFTSDRHKCFLCNSQFLKMQNDDLPGGSQDWNSLVDHEIGLIITGEILTRNCISIALQVYG